MASINNEYPYTNMVYQNIDWLIKEVIALKNQGKTDAETKESTAQSVFAQIGVPNEYPYTNMVYQNIDWLIATVAKHGQDIEAIKADITALREEDKLLWQALDNKVDKTSKANQVYTTDTNGEQITKTYSMSEIAGTIVQRNLNANISAVTENEATEKNTRLTNISYIDAHCVARETSPANSVYAIDGSGNQIMIRQSTDVNGYTLPLRTASGTVKVGEPTEDNEATTKKYVDSEVSQVENRVINNENVFAEKINDLEIKIVSNEGTIGIVDGRVDDLETKVDELGSGWEVLYEKTFTTDEEPGTIDFPNSENVIGLRAEYYIDNNTDTNYPTGNTTICEFVNGMPILPTQLPTTTTEETLTTIESSVISESQTYYNATLQKMSGTIPTAKISGSDFVKNGSTIVIDAVSYTTDACLENRTITNTYTSNTKAQSMTIDQSPVISTNLPPSNDVLQYRQYYVDGTTIFTAPENWGINQYKALAVYSLAGESTTYTVTDVSQLELSNGFMKYTITIQQNTGSTHTLIAYNGANAGEWKGHIYMAESDSQVDLALKTNNQAETKTETVTATAIYNSQNASSLVYISNDGYIYATPNKEILVANIIYTDSTTGTAYKGAYITEVAIFGENAITTYSTGFANLTSFSGQTMSEQTSQYKLFGTTSEKIRLFPQGLKLAAGSKIRISIQRGKQK